MFRLIIFLIIGIPATVASMYFFATNVPGLGVLFGGIALVDFINYFGRKLELKRNQDKPVTDTDARSKPLGLILLLILGTPIVLGFLGGLIGTAIEQVTLGYAPGYYALFLGAGGVLLGVAVGAVLAVK